MATCYLCGQPVDSSRSTGDHVIPRTLLGARPPKVRGFDYGGRQQTHPECNNGFGDETHVRKALQLLGALHDSEATLSRCSPGNPNARVLALNEEKLPGFAPRDFRFFGIHDARNDSISRLEDPEYYADKPRADPIKTALCTTLSVSCLSLKVRSPMPCSCSCLSPTRSQRRRRELHGADSDMAQRLETAMAHTLRLGSLAELHG